MSTNSALAPLFLALLWTASATPCQAQEDPAPPSVEKAGEEAQPARVTPEGEGESSSEPEESSPDEAEPADSADGPAEGEDGESEDGEGEGEGGESEGEAGEGEGDLADLDADLERLLEDDVASGASGSFGYRLTEYGIDPYIHAYVTFDYVNFEEKKVRNTFDLHYFNLFVGANIRDTIVPELQIEYEHGSEEIAVRFAQVDIKLHEMLQIRAGLWLVPFGTYNEFLYPEFLSKTPRGPILQGTLRELIPVAWNDVGVQLRGRFALGEKMELNYVAYVSNGLEQEDDPTTIRVEDGGRIRSMRENFRDKNDGHKSVGGRVGFKGFGLNIGTSIYHGAYTEDGNQNITFYGFDAIYERGGLQIGIEVVYVHQRREDLADNYRKGFFVWASYKFENVLGDLFALDVEPVVALDWVRLGDRLTSNRAEKAGNRRGWIGGVNFYPFPQVLPNLNWRVFYAGYDQNGDEVRDNIFMAQLTLGF